MSNPLLDPYELLLRGSANPCCPADHARRKNCGENPWCVFGLGEKKDGIYKSSIAEIGKLGPDPASLRRRDHTPVGIKNLGATCYLNVLVQSLFHNLLVRDAVFNLVVPDSGLSQMDHVLRALQTTFGHLQHSNRAVHNIAAFARLLQLDEQEQQDPQEFYKLFMGKFDNLQNGLRDSSPAQLGMTQILRGEEAYSMRCSACQGESARIHAFSGLELPIEGLSSVRAAMAAYFAQEEMSGENQYFCERCGGKRDAVRYTRIEKTPALLNIQLLRYVYDRKTFEKSKLQQDVEFEDSIEVDGVSYRLVSVLFHKGRSAYGGHYVAEVLDWGTGQWWHCDDDTVTATENPAISSHAGSARDPLSVDNDGEFAAQTKAHSKSAAKPKKKASKATPVKDTAVKRRKTESGSSPEQHEVVDLDGDGDAAEVGADAEAEIDSVFQTPSEKSNGTSKSKKQGGSAAAKESSIRLDRSKDAYMFSYVREEVLLQAQRRERVPATKLAADDAANDAAAFETQIAQYAFLRQQLEDAVNTRKSSYEIIRTNLLPARDRSEGEGFHLVPTEWLRQWITGVKSSDESAATQQAGAAGTAGALVDLTDDVSKHHAVAESAVVDAATGVPGGAASVIRSAIFDDGIRNLRHRCKHRQSAEPHMDYRAIGAYKVVSDAAFRVMVGDAVGAAESRLDHDFHAGNYRCAECCDEFAQTRQRELGSADKCRRILALVAKDDREMDFKSADGYFVANKWLTSVKKFCESLDKEAERAAGGKVPVQKSAKSLISSWVTTSAAGGSGGDDKESAGSSGVLVDSTVNGMLLCEHGHTYGSHRAKKVSVATWEAIKEAFPECVEWPATADSTCRLCTEASKNTSEARKNLSREKGDELAQKGDDLRALLKRSDRTHPLVFDDQTSILSPLTSPELAGQQFYLVDRNWLKWWRSFHELSTVTRPDFLSNLSLRCEHGLSVMPDQLGRITSGTCPCDHPREGTLGDGLPPAELISAAQWKALSRLYGPAVGSVADCEEVSSIGSKRKPAEDLDGKSTQVSDEEMPDGCEVKEESGNVDRRSFAVMLRADEAGAWHWHPSVCSSCVEQRKRVFRAGIEEFTNRLLTMVVLKPGDADPTLSAPCGTPGGAASGEDKDKEEPVLGKRRSSRKKSAGQTFDISASSGDTLSLIKLKNSERLLEHFDGIQTLFLRGQELVGNDLTLAALGVRAGDVLYVRVQESKDNASFANLLVGGGRSARAEIGFQGTFLSFNNAESSGSGSGSKRGRAPDAEAGVGGASMPVELPAAVDVDQITDDNYSGGSVSVDADQSRLRQLALDMHLRVSDLDVENALSSAAGSLDQAMVILLANRD